ncbi:MAG TPA: TIGR02996 domain-containing protein, partial [Gemmata sp.]
MTEAEAFERAILDSPDDLNTYAAYGDWLQDRDDPRGAFIAVQLALEDSSRSTGERRALQDSEARLLGDHERGWLGALAPHLLDGDHRPRAEHWWARGFLTEVRVEALTFAFAQALAVTSAARTLRALRIESSLHPAYRGDAKPAALLPPGETAYESYFELIGSPCLE